MTYLFEQVDLDKSESLSLSEINAALDAGNERLVRLLTALQRSFKRVDQNGDEEQSNIEKHNFQTLEEKDHD